MKTWCGDEFKLKGYCEGIIPGEYHAPDNTVCTDCNLYRIYNQCLLCYVIYTDGRPYIFDSRIFYFEYYYKGGSGYRYGTVYTVYIYTIILIG